MRLVHQPEVCFETFEHVGPRAEQSTIGGKQVVERRAPPGEFELSGDLLLGDVPAGEVGQQRVQVEASHRRHQLAALLEVLQHVGVRGERGEHVAEAVQRHGGELGLSRGVAERHVERGKVGRELLPRDGDIRDAGRDLGNDARRDETLPHDALPLDGTERLVQIADMHAGPNIFFGQLLESATIDRRHLRSIAPRGRGDDQFAERPIEHSGGEAIEGVPDVGEQPEIDPQFSDGRKRSHPGGADEPLRHNEQPRQFLAMDLLRECVESVRVIAVGELCSVPRRVAGSVAELAQPSRFEHGVRDRCAIGGQSLDRELVETRGGRRRNGQQGEPGELGHAVRDRNAQSGVRAGEGTAVVEEHGAEANERLVDLAERRGLCSLIARDGAHEVAAQAGGADRDSVQPDVGEALRDPVEGGASRAHHEDTFVLADQAAEGVDDGLRSPGARHGLDDQRVSGGDLGDHLLLFGIRVQQENVGGGIAMVGVDRLDGGVALLQRPPGGRVAGQRIEDRMLQLDGVGDETGRDIREGGHHQPRRDREVGKVPGEGAQLVDDGVRFEASVGVGKGDETVGIQHHPELLLEREGERRVENGDAAQLDLEVASVAADGQRAEQHRGAEVLDGELIAVVVVAGVLGGGGPAGEPDAEVDGVDAAGGGELEPLRRDPVRGKPSRAECHVVADQLREQRGLAGDETGEATGMRRAEFDPRARLVDEVQQGRAPSDSGELGTPLLADRVGDIAGVPGARGDDTGHGIGAIIARSVLGHENLIPSVGRPHAPQATARAPESPGPVRGFARCEGRRPDLKL